MVPEGTELDLWEGHSLVSLVGFLFVDTRVKGCAIPWHRTFEEVNLRFYVRRVVGDELRRGVVFVRELVPRTAIAAVARVVYNEPYVAVPMAHRVDLDEGSGGSATYSWRYRGGEYAIHASVRGPAQALVPGHEAEFITEHYFGYNRQRDGSSLEYRVLHPPWRVWTCETAEYAQPGDPRLYGDSFTEVLRSPPSSAFLAVGSEVEVHSGTPLDAG